METKTEKEEYCMKNHETTTREIQNSQMKMHYT